MPNPGNLISNSERTPKELRDQTSRGGKASGKARRRKKNLQQTAKAIMELPLTDAYIDALKDKGINMDNVDPEDMTAMCAVVIGQIMAAAGGNSQAASVLAGWLETGEQKKKRLENKKLEAEIERIVADTERLRSGHGVDDDDKVLQFIKGMMGNDTSDTKAD